MAAARAHTLEARAAELLRRCRLDGGEPLDEATPPRGPRDPVSQRETGPTVLVVNMPPFPAISSIALPPTRLAAQLGDLVTVVGRNLTGTALTLVATNQARGFKLTLSPASNAGATAASFLMPNDPVNVPAGPYTASLSLARPGDNAIVTTNEVALSIAPQIVSIPATAQLAADAREAKRGGGPIKIVVTGHTDTSGPEKYNEGLGLRRAEKARAALEAALRKAGAGATAIASIEIASVGEQHLNRADGRRQA
jgi:hypothetical protein